jgi:hypothetical protein
MSYTVGKERKFENVHMFYSKEKVVELQKKIFK